MKATACLLNVARPLTASRAQSMSFVGLGRMGFEMAYNLFSRTLVENGSGARFVVCDARKETAEGFASNFLHHFPGARIDVALTPEEALLASRTIITMLPSSPHVQSVYSESQGIISALRTLPPDEAQSTLCIDSTTLDVQVARGVAAEVQVTGANMVDAPVSGGVIGAKAATLSFLVGGSDAAFELARPTLAHMGKKIIHCGSSGAGLAAKICNNLMLGVEQIVTAEAMILGQKLGLEPKVLAAVVNSSTGGCWSSLMNNPVPGAVPDKSPPSERDFEGGFATSLMLKDMGLAKDVAEKMESPLPLGCAAEELYATVIKNDPELANKDFSSVYRYMRTAETRK
ncbi:3-hydroxyisobutyrate dehydrogenase [Wolfiporia cocos MD-104 SS10]|uniref:3-hydroxyisobutyrate dehydrogenase n=1 Tax=Wolfiporia cocos (strain MD-104) TaxID=742152 RepID=A0A2H3J8V3_WOLCO|nr:3-hydroxyisobutyrate dehydrogenase [Wolfiporia cocos MD-104 SS10]